jgi:outer membrane protein
MILMPRRLIAVAMAALTLGIAQAQESKMKIATVDMMLLFNEYHKTNLVRQDLNAEKARIAKKNTDKLTAIRAIENDVRLLKSQSEDGTLSEQKKIQVYKDYTYKYQEGIQLEKARQEAFERDNLALRELTADKMRAVLKEIRDLVESHAKSENYDYVFDKSGMSTSQVPFLLFAKDAAEITPLLLKELNKNAPAEATSTQPAPAPAPSSGGTGGTGNDGQ